MSNPKKLTDLSYEDLCNIAKAINKNTLDNKTKNKEDRLSTDHFLRKKFNISRKDFSFTIKETGIEYNRTTFMYDIKNYKSNSKVIHNQNLTDQQSKSIIDKSNINVVHEVAATFEEQIKEKEVEEYKSNTYILYGELEKELPTLLDMIAWYKLQNDSIKESSELQTELTLNDSRLSGDIGSHPIKCYEAIFLEFKQVCKQNPGYKQQDLISKALLEFIDKYKK